MERPRSQLFDNSHISAARAFGTSSLMFISPVLHVTLWKRFCSPPATFHSPLPLSPIIPTHTSDSPVSPMIPTLTQNRWGGGGFRAAKSCRAHFHFRRYLPSRINIAGSVSARDRAQV